MGRRRNSTTKDPATDWVFLVRRSHFSVPSSYMGEDLNFTKKERRGYGVEEKGVNNLIDQIHRGNRDAFEPIILKFQQKMFKFCFFMLGNRQAEDAVQEVFFKAYRHLSSYRHDSDELFQAWLYKIAANHCRSLLKRKNKWNLLMSLFRNEASMKSTEHIQSLSEQSELQLQWLEDLSLRRKLILALRVLEDQSFEEIAGVLGVSSAVVRKRFERLRAKLRQKNEHQEGMRYEQRFE